jgi:hypothetical protein
MTYRQPEGRTRFFIAVLACCLFGLSWCQERKR